MEIKNTFTVQPGDESGIFQPADAPQLEVVNYTSHVASVVFAGLADGHPTYQIKLDNKFIWVTDEPIEMLKPVFSKSVRFTFFDQAGVAALGGNQGAVSALMSMVVADVAIREEDSEENTSWTLVETSTDGEFHPIKFITGDDEDSPEAEDAAIEAALSAINE